MIRVVFCLLTLLASVQPSFAGEPWSKDDRHLEVSMRMIGHQVMLGTGDRTSRILPIEKNGDTYIIRFTSEFEFNPEDLAPAIDSVVSVTNSAESYIVEFRTCESDLVVHSYEVGISEYTNVLACRTRHQPKGCYYLAITILKPGNPMAPVVTAAQEAESKGMMKPIGMLLMLALALFAFVKFNRYKKPYKDASQDPNVIPIGEYRFNKSRMELCHGDEKVELTSKECDLLQLLCDSTNNTVERDTILRTVWGDEGDYVGRTLDVFISKLRKKLEADSNVRIINVRGIGYKLMVSM